jgi:hypothetical protein
LPPGQAEALIATIDKLEEQADLAFVAETFKNMR